MINLFHTVSKHCSEITTKTYSTSFCSAIKLLHKDLRPHIHNIYGFVRLADEIVDTFHDFDKSTLLQEFKEETFKAIARRISLNPILNSFQSTVNKYEIDEELIHAFFVSMQSDLEKKSYDEAAYKKYIYGSSETVGLMCLSVFCEGDNKKYKELGPYATSLGAAFQKVNFLRDIQADYNQLNRIYFPQSDVTKFTISHKKAIEEDIQKDFDNAYQGIMQLPAKAKFGVYVAYKYYLSLFNKIKKMPLKYVLETRVRIADYSKFFIVANAGVKMQMNIL